MKITDQQLNRAIYSLWDFQQALSAITFLLEDCEFEEKHNNITLRRFRCYESNFIISMARPFEKSKSGTTIGLRALGINLSKNQKLLVEKILNLRRKIIAHSAEEEMHFKVSTFPVDEKLNFPNFQFDEGLHLEKRELLELEEFLKILKSEMARFFFKLAQENPEMLNKYKQPARRGRNTWDCKGFHRLSKPLKRQDEARKGIAPHGFQPLCRAFGLSGRWKAARTVWAKRVPQPPICGAKTEGWSGSGVAFSFPYFFWLSKRNRVANKAKKYVTKNWILRFALNDGSKNMLYNPISMSLTGQLNLLWTNSSIIQIPFWKRD